MQFFTTSPTSRHLSAIFTPKVDPALWQDTALTWEAVSFIAYPKGGGLRNRVARQIRQLRKQARA